MCLSRLEEQEKLVTAEGLYRRALSLDDLNPEAQQALHKITDAIQVSGPQHTHTQTNNAFLRPNLNVLLCMTSEKQNK